jgi:hypothetical protein
LKFHNQISPPLVISDIEDIYSSQLNYKWFLSNKESLFEWEMNPPCDYIQINKTFQCNAISTLTNTSILIGNVAQQTFSMNISQICGCDFSQSDILCLNGTMIQGKCCTMNLTSCFVPCSKPCELYPVVIMENKTTSIQGKYQSPNPFLFIRKFKLFKSKDSMQIKSMSPNAVYISTTPTVVINGGPFVEGYIQGIIIKPVEMVDGVPVNSIIRAQTSQTWSLYNSTLYPSEFISTSFQIINYTTIIFTIPSLPYDYIYEIYFNTSFIQKIENFGFRVYGKLWFI